LREALQPSADQPIFRQAAERLQRWEVEMAGRANIEMRERRKLEAELDKALAQTFPASDPYSVGRFTSTEPPARPVDRQAPELDEQLVEGSRSRHQRKSR
jgi:hypothetical protein